MLLHRAVGSTGLTVQRHALMATCGDRPTLPITSAYFQPLVHKLGTITRRRPTGLSATVAVSGRISPSNGLALLLSVMDNVRTGGRRYVRLLLAAVVTPRKKAFVSIVLELRQTAACLGRKFFAGRILLRSRRAEAVCIAVSPTESSVLCSRLAYQVTR